MTTASVNEPKGIGGWLILVAINLIVVPIRYAIDLYSDVYVGLTPEVWSALTSPESEVYSPLWKPLIAFEVISGLLFVAYTFWVAWLFFTKSRRAPKFIMAWLAANAILALVSLGMLMEIPLVFAEMSRKEMVDSVRPSIFALIWILYFLKSKRVKNTFIEPSD